MLDAELAEQLLFALNVFLQTLSSLLLLSLAAKEDDVALTMAASPHPMPSNF